MTTQRITFAQTQMVGKFVLNIDPKTRCEIFGTFVVHNIKQTIINAYSWHKANGRISSIEEMIQVVTKVVNGEEIGFTLTIENA